MVGGGGGGWGWDIARDLGIRVPFTGSPGLERFEV